MDKVRQLREFYDELEKHDWYYSYSDDHRVWKKGEAAWKALVAKGNQSEAHQELLDGFQAYHFGGEAFGTEPQPKPERP